MSNPLAVMCERHERVYGGTEARWKTRPLLDDICPLCVMERDSDALRKRVEELEISAGSASMTIRLAQERAEKAERERDELMENHQALGREYEAQGRVADKLQADLDAALDLLSMNLKVQPTGELKERLSAAHDRIRPMLEKRREKRG